MKPEKEIIVRASDLRSLMKVSLGRPNYSSNSANIRCTNCRNWRKEFHHLTANFSSRVEIYICKSCAPKVEREISKILRFPAPSELYKILEAKQRRRIQLANNAKSRALNKLEVKAKPYIDIGLPEVFAHSIAANPEASESILDLWEATWWKQYEPTDPMITSVLNGTITEETAKWMDSFRSDHPELVWAILNQSVSIEWARALLESGFDGCIDQVNAALSGGNPKIIARISKMRCEKDLIPPTLQTPADCSEPVISSYSVQSEPIVVESDPHLLEDFIGSFESQFPSKSQKYATELLKDLGLTGSGRTPSKVIFEDVFWEMIEIEKEIVAKKLPKTKGPLMKKAGNIRIKGRGSMGTSELQRKIKQTHKEMVSWAASL